MTLLAALFAVCALMLFAPDPGTTAPPDPATKHGVRILRDIRGAPHVFGKKDTDAAFGLAYAHAEDDFRTMQLIMMAISGRLASVLGPGGAGNDYLVHLIRLRDTVDAKYHTDLDPQARAARRKTPTNPMHRPIIAYRSMKSRSSKNSTAGARSSATKSPRAS